VTSSIDCLRAPLGPRHFRVVAEGWSIKPLASVGRAILILDRRLADVTSGDRAPAQSKQHENPYCFETLQVHHQPLTVKNMRGVAGPPKGNRRALFTIKVKDSERPGSRVRPDGFKRGTPFGSSDQLPQV
jgi:hypothetical protein